MVSYDIDMLYVVQNKRTIRKRNEGKFEQCLKLRQQGLSYSEIQVLVPVAKSTLQNWLTLGGLTLTKEHLEIQLRKRIASKRAATEAAKFTRMANRDKLLLAASKEYRQYFSDPLFLMGIMLYESEGTKMGDCRFSNSDYRLIRVFMVFMERYFHVQRNNNMKLSLFIHETRKGDLCRIVDFWSQKLSIGINEFTIYWKRNIVSHRRNNPDYVGQIQLRIIGIPYLTRKLRLFSDIIVSEYVD